MAVVHLPETFYTSFFAKLQPQRALTPTFDCERINVNKHMHNLYLYVAVLPTASPSTSSATIFTMEVVKWCQHGDHWGRRGFSIPHSTFWPCTIRVLPVRCILTSLTVLTHSCTQNSRSKYSRTVVALPTHFLNTPGERLPAQSEGVVTF